MAATWQAIFSSFLIFVIALAQGHEAHDHVNPNHAHNHADANHNHVHNHANANLNHAHNHANANHNHANVDLNHAHNNNANDQPHSAMATTPWKDAHATFYGGADGTLGGACGYEDKDKQTFGRDTTALSTALFHNGSACGACFEIKCEPDKEQAQQWCKPGQPTVVVTATDFCPGGGEGWCNSPKEHFDLSQPAFIKIAEYKGGIVPVKYRRIPCKRQGGVQFKITGNAYFNLVGITNVGGAGDVVKVEVKVGAEWKALDRNYGEEWETNAKLVGQILTFRITTSDGKSTISEHVAPENWQFGQTYQGIN